MTPDLPTAERDILYALADELQRQAGPRSEWRRIRVPTLDDPEGCLPPGGDPCLLYDGGFSLGWFEAGSLRWHYDDGDYGSISDHDRKWWHPLPDPPKTEASDDA